MGLKHCKLKPRTTGENNSTLKASGHGCMANNHRPTLFPEDRMAHTDPMDSERNGSKSAPSPSPVSILSVRAATKDPSFALNRKKSDSKVRFSEKPSTIDYYVPNKGEASKRPGVFIKIFS
jgi:hypothetical protein